jgi:TonB family protein
MRTTIVLLFVVLLSLVVAAQFQTQSPGAALETAARGSARIADKPAEPNIEPLPAQSVDILTPTDGVNLGPYLQTVMANVRQNWVRYIPDSARGPARKGAWSRKPKLAQGHVKVEFVIRRNGYIKDLHVADSSGDEELDQAALSGVSASAPFPHLPEKLKSETLHLRFHFYYNPSHLPRKAE